MSALVKHYAPIYAIEIYRNDFREKIGTLIPSVQKEFGIEITLADQPDLLNIPAVYQQGGGNFWVALNNGEVIGTIALIDIGNNIGVIRKMFLAPDHRGTGIGQQLLDTLLAWATSHGFAHLYLGTTERFAAAMRFYERNGFVITDILPTALEKIRMKVDTIHYHRTLSA